MKGFCTGSWKSAYQKWKVRSKVLAFYSHRSCEFSEIFTARISNCRIFFVTGSRYVPECEQVNPSEVSFARTCISNAKSESDPTKSAISSAVIGSSFHLVIPLECNKSECPASGPLGFERWPKTPDWATGLKAGEAESIFNEMPRRLRRDFSPPFHSPGCPARWPGRSATLWRAT